jgi:hypothetical protein
MVNRVQRAKAKELAAQRVLLSSSLIGVLHK